VVSHNVGADNPDPVGSARALVASGADVLALEEVTAQARGVYEEELARDYPHHAVLGTVAVWSRLPLSDTRPVDTEMDAGPLGDAKSDEVKLAYNRALRTTVATDQGPLAVYVAHLGSVRVLPSGGFQTESRDRNAQALAEAVAAEPNGRVVLLGDLNGTVDDRALAGLTARLSPAHEAAGGGFGFSWPAGFPVVGGCGGAKLEMPQPPDHQAADQPPPRRISAKLHQTVRLARPTRAPTTRKPRRRVRARCWATRTAPGVMPKTWPVSSAENPAITRRTSRRCWRSGRSPTSSSATWTPCPTTRCPAAPS
jgi:endonuclease/exonuclease/phosphatase family metal-dependent hydrolase